MAIPYYDMEVTADVTRTGPLGTTLERGKRNTMVAQHLPLFGGFIGVGANAFYYKQITGDNGEGAKLGDFKGQTMGVGPVLSYAMKVGKEKTTDLAVELKWLPESDVEAFRRRYPLG